MNYYQYKKRAPRRRGGSDYFKPFLLILLLIAIFLAGWRLVGTLFVDDGSNDSSQKVLLEIDSGSAKAMTSGGREWKNIPSSINLYEGEKVKTQSDGRLTLSLFDGSLARLDRSSEVEFETLTQESVVSKIDLKLNKGNLWVNTEDSVGFSDFSVSTSQFILRSDSSALFTVTAPSTLYVLKGLVKADVLENGKVIKSLNVGVGQQLVLTSSIIADLSVGLEKELLFALEDDFKTSGWYRWNMKEEGVVSNSEAEIPATLEEEAEVPKEDNKEEEEVVEAEGEKIDENDETAPTVPEFSTPGNNDAVVTIDALEQVITGKVSKDTYAVIVNDYRLSRYVPGSGSFSYTASTAFANLVAGENKYEAIALDRAGNKSEIATITLVLPDELVEDQDGEPEDEEEEAASPSAASSSGSVSFTFPNEGQNLVTSETSFVITGSVPSNTANVEVNDYELQAYTAGSSSFSYNANSTLGTLKIGEVNTYTAKAFDEDGELIGTATMTIDVESVQGGSGNPVITIPSASSTYETTLNELVIGGSIGKWVDKVYLNGVSIADYIPGSEEWSINVALTPGENVITVYGQTDGANSTSTAITIVYNQ